MKVQKLPLIVGAIVISLTAATSAVQAEITAQRPLIVAQNAQNRQNNNKWERLNLTQEQRTQIEAIKRETRSQIEGILTPEQRQQAQTAWNNNGGDKPKNGLRNLNLSDEQRTQVREIMRSSKEKMEAVLTDEQKEQLRQMKQDGRSRRPQTNS
ncbi:MAG: P pilus assembly/Cpx signaling pathway, periplasmic inhibitor/zinc-resistance associated protein [Scytonematopsis contorta HA4267-MV1]|jgi:Spy/CpxP family protein refolding chaperone|nr:P pilus assembly/Cpx signaling pathway, periplasmic inhibitor/zinc-resistance associated protein [Scytonematopsis contorta HA4267-MV1]